MHFNILTLFPDMFPGNLAHSLAGKALEKELWSYDAIDIRDYADQHAVHKAVDDTPYGGGAGMVMRPDIIDKAIQGCSFRNKGDKSADSSSKPKIIYPSPRGKKLTQRKIEELTQLDEVTILCGRYEGVDQRVIDKYDMEEVSIGDFILSGGEIAAFVIIDACIRKINGVIGNAQTHIEESFACGEFEFLLEYPLYTKPYDWEGKLVPDVLRSGNHKEINKWRLKKAEELTEIRRPDLWSSYKKGKE